jgi:predicted amidohydrolase
MYAGEQQTMSMEEAVRKMTSLAASRVGLLDRGILRPGAFADIAVFDPKTIRDAATFSDPMHYSVGVRYVFVNGTPVTERLQTSARGVPSEVPAIKRNIANGWKQRTESCTRAIRACISHTRSKSTRSRRNQAS